MRSVRRRANIPRTDRGRPNMLAQTLTDQEVGGLVLFSGVFLIIWLAIVILAIAGMWATFKKAGKPGWAAIVPFYNIIVWCEIVGRPAWWLLLCLIPGVGFVIFIILALDLAKSFGKGAGFALGMMAFGISTRR